MILADTERMGQMHRRWVDYKPGSNHVAEGKFEAMQK